MNLLGPRLAGVADISIKARTSYLQWEPWMTETWTHVHMVVSPVLSHWAIPLSPTWGTLCANEVWNGNKETGETYRSMDVKFIMNVWGTWIEFLGWGKAAAAINAINWFNAFGEYCRNVTAAILLLKQAGYELDGYNEGKYCLRMRHSEISLILVASELTSHLIM